MDCFKLLISSTKYSLIEPKFLISSSIPYNLFSKVGKTFNLLSIKLSTSSNLCSNSGCVDTRSILIGTALYGFSPGLFNGMPLGSIKVAGESFICVPILSSFLYVGSVVGSFPSHNS